MSDSVVDPVADPKVRHVVDAGRALGLEVRPRTFEQETRTARDAANAVGCHVSQIVKSLIFEAAGTPVLLLVSGANRVDLKLAAAAAGVDRLDKADATEVKASTGFSIGATPPFGHLRPISVLMDRDLLDHDEVWASGGRPDTVWPVDPHALMEATGAIVCDLRDS